jgi:formylglycine-generating enzyme
MMITMARQGMALLLRGDAELGRDFVAACMSRALSLLPRLVSLIQRKWKIAIIIPTLCLTCLICCRAALQAEEYLPENFVPVRGGEFTIGSPESENGHQIDEIQHQARVSDFYICKYAVTVAEFRRFIETSGYRTDAEKGDGSWIFDGEKVQKKAGMNWRHGVSGSLRSQAEENHPVLHVSWNDAIAYCQWMSEKTGKLFRLPTGGEREYACRAGSRTPFNTGENITTEQANYDGNHPYNNNQKGIYRGNTVAVNSFTPNTWGLYNMHGNVLEWCSDWYGLNYYDECKAAGTVINPVGPATGSNRVLRGGSWNDFARRCRSASRDSGTPDFRCNYAGFRLVFIP